MSMDRLTFLACIASSAKLLAMLTSSIRFQSTINNKIFSLAFEDGQFDFVELLRNIPKPDRTDMRPIYEGNDEAVLRATILQELTASSTTLRTSALTS